MRTPRSAALLVSVLSLPAPACSPSLASSRVELEAAPAPTPAPSRSVRLRRRPRSAAPPATSLRGTIGGKPFVARSALVVRLDEPMSQCSSTTRPQGASCFEGAPWATEVKTSWLHIYEHVATCDDVRPQFGRVGRLMAPLPPGTHFVELELTFDRPFGRRVIPRGNTWTVSPIPAANGEFVDASFHDAGTNGALGTGTVTLTPTSKRAGILSLHLRAKNPSLALSGDVSGDIPYVVCAPAPHR